MALSQVYSRLKERGKSSAVDDLYDYMESSQTSILETT